MKLFLASILLFLGGNSFAQISNFKALVGYTESQVKQLVTGHNSVKEAYSEDGKTILYTFNDFEVMYAIKANKKCSKVWVIFKSQSLTSLMNQWFYDNDYNSKKNIKTGNYEWTKTITIKSPNSGASNDEFILTAIKLDNTTFFFADKIATLLGY